jgi:tRNA A-37 threonylcarbamoyl transferase component Bud32/WD40 repeat protein
MKVDDEKAPSPTASTISDTGPGRLSDVVSEGMPLVSVPTEYYEILGEQGRGGIGVVLRARDRRLGRLVAIKQLKSASAATLERFEREMRITARLQHAGIVPVHEAGWFAGGQAFYAMKLIEGQSLRRRLDVSGSLDARLGYLPQLLAVAETIAYAHSRGVIHRDLKPDNVMVGDFGEAIVVDWGLAKQLDHDDATSSSDEAAALDAKLTVAGDVVGTPAYMPPEQARGDAVDERADVWSLGAMIYYLITARPPYDADTGTEILRLVVREPPTPPTSLQPEAPAELVAIVEHAMARDPSARYRHAGELASDLRRFLTGNLVSAHRYSALNLVARWARRHRAVLAVAAVALAALVVGGVVSVTRIVASQRLAEARANRLLLAEAARSLDADPARTVSLLAQYPAAGAGWDRVEELARSAARAGLPRAVYKVSSSAAVAFSRDGNRLAVADRDHLRTFDAQSGAPLATFAVPAGGEAQPTGIRWLVDGSILLARVDGVMWLVDEHAAAPTRLAPGHGVILDATSDDTGGQLVASCADGAVWLWDRKTRTGRVVATHPGGAYQALFAGAQLVSIGADGRVVIVDLGSGSSRSHAVATVALTALALTSDARQAAVGTISGDLFVLDLGDGHAELQQRSPEGAIGLLAFARQETAVISLANGGRLIVRDLASGQDQVLRSDATFFAMSTDAAWLVAGRRDGGLTRVHLASGWQRDTRAHDREISWLAVSAGGQLATVAADLTARLWPDSLAPFALLNVGAEVLDLHGSATDGTLLVGTASGRVEVRGLDGGLHASATPQPGPATTRFGARDVPVVSVDLRGGHLVVLDDALLEQRRFDLGAPISDLRARVGTIACGHPSGEVSLLSVGSGELMRRAVFPAGHAVRRLRWLDDRRVVVASQAGELALLDVTSGTATPLAGLKVGVLGLGVAAPSTVLLLGDDGARRTIDLEHGSFTDETACVAKARRLTEAREGNLFAWTCGRSISLDGAPGSAAQLQLAEDGALLDLSSSSGRLLVALNGGRVELWDFHDDRIGFYAVADRVIEAQLLARGRILAATAPGGIVELWHVDDADLVPLSRRSLVPWLRATSGRFALDQLPAEPAGGL